MILGLSDKVAIVTGGSEGIGYATAGVLLEHGASVAIAARRAEVLERAAESLREHGGKVLPVVADVSARTSSGSSRRPWRASAGSTSWSTTRERAAPRSSKTST
jgi:NAD(P)-dependent dehydrogenase (short-subunit alcohol dehydrogenase family)